MGKYIEIYRKIWKTIEPHRTYPSAQAQSRHIRKVWNTECTCFCLRLQWSSRAIILKTWRLLE